MIPYISTADLGAVLGQDVTTDPLAAIAIDAACETVRSYLDNHLNYEVDDVLTLDGTGTSVIVLPNPPVLEVTDVQESGETLAETDDFILAPFSLLYRVGLSWPKGRANIVVTYSHGYAISEDDVEDDPSDDDIKPERMPSDIRLVTLELAKGLFSSAGSTVGAVTSETIGSYSYTVDAGSLSASGGGLTLDQRYRLDHYIDRGVA